MKNNLAQVDCKYSALVVEDDPDQLTIFTQALEISGYTTESVTDVDSAQQFLADTTPHLIVLDLHLPGLSGETLLESLRTDPRFKDTKVVLATADHLWANKLESEAELVLLKPVSFKQLRQLSQRLLPR